MTEDVVAELDRWRRTPRTAENAHEFVPISELLRRARDEIMALRQEMTHDSAAIATLCNHARDKALEEAAQIMDQHRGQVITGEFLAWAIRELKDRRDG